MNKFLKKAGLAVLLFANVAFAADNSIYIDQTGSDSTIDITQTGSGNVIRGIQGVGTSNATPAKMSGDAALVDIRQIGADNTMNLGFTVTTAAGFGYGIDLTYYVTGNNGLATFNINNSGTGVAASNLIDVRQTGNSAGVNLTMTGTANSFVAVTSGGNNNFLTATINADETVNNISMTGGANNTLTQTITSNRATNNITTVGASNSITMTQSGVAGTNGHSATIGITGSSNTMGITQTGTVDNVLNINSVGSGNTWTILQGQ
jgi:hypothetical protein